MIQYKYTLSKFLLCLTILIIPEFCPAHDDPETWEARSIMDKVNMKLGIDSPLDEAMAKMILELVNESPNFEKMSAAQKLLLAGDIAYKLKRKGLKWTVQDQENYDNKKPLVKNFEEVLEEIKKSNQLVGFLKVKLDQKNSLSQMEKRVLQAFLIFDQEEQAYEAKVRGGRKVARAIRDYAIRRNGAVPGAATEGKNSNEVLRVLFENKLIQEEDSFYVEGIKGIKQGDGKIVGEQALAAGENIWAININANLLESREHMPLLVAPLKKAKNGKWIADKEAYGGKVIVVQVNGFTDVYDIGKNGEIITVYGDLLSSEHPCWSNMHTGVVDTPEFCLPLDLRVK